VPIELQQFSSKSTRPSDGGQDHEDRGDTEEDLTTHSGIDATIALPSKSPQPCSSHSEFSRSATQGDRNDLAFLPAPITPGGILASVPLYPTQTVISQTIILQNRVHKTKNRSALDSRSHGRTVPLRLRLSLSLIAVCGGGKCFSVAGVEGAVWPILD
jgi:hypothetical protein